MGYFQFIPLVVPALEVFFVLEPIKSYKYSFLTHILVPMVMLLFIHQNHKQWLKSHFPYTVHLSIMLLERPPHIHPRSHNLAWFIKPFFVMHGFFFLKMRECCTSLY